jgi:hypothetical protein
VARGRESGRFRVSVYISSTRSLENRVLENAPLG